jgi:hypothetical protein
MDVMREAIERDPSLQEEVQFMSRISQILTAHRDQLETEVPASIPAIDKPRKARRIWLPALATCGVVLLAMAVVPNLNQAKEARMETSAVAGSAAPMSQPKPESSAKSAEAFGDSAEDSPLRNRISVPEDKSRETERRTDLKTKRTSNGVSVATPRNVIKTADIGLRVKDVKTASNSLTLSVSGVGGFVASSSVNQDDSSGMATLTLRVPTKNFNVFLESIRALGEVTSESMTGDDVTMQRIDLESELQSKKDELASLRSILRETRRIGEVLAVRDRITQVQSEIASIEGQLAYVKDAVAYSTFNITLTQRPGGPKTGEDTKGSWSGDTWNGAVEGLSTVGRGIGQAGITLFVFAPIWLPLVGVTYWLYRRSRTSK